MFPIVMADSPLPTHPVSAFEVVLDGYESKTVPLSRYLSQFSIPMVANSPMASYAFKMVLVAMSQRWCHCHCYLTQFSIPIMVDSPSLTCAPKMVLGGCESGVVPLPQYLFNFRFLQWQIFKDWVVKNHLWCHGICLIFQ